MRKSVTILALALSACSDSIGPIGTDPEVPRGDYLLLIERFVPGGARSFYQMTTEGGFFSPFPAPVDARRLIPSPDGRRIAWLRDHDDLVHLWIMDRDGDGRAPVLQDERLVEHASWSPDGTRLVIETSTLSQTSDIMVVNADGSNLVNLTPDPLPAVVFDLAPDWSPDGTRIAFSSNRTGRMRLFVMNANGSNVVQVVSDPNALGERGPVWSPDGSMIAFSAGNNADPANGNGIGVVRPNGADYRFIPVQGDVGRVAWLPDGRVLYSTNSGTNYEIYAFDLTSNVAVNLTNHADHDYRASVMKYVAPESWRGYGAASTFTLNRGAIDAIESGDVNRDGLPDIIASTRARSELQVIRGTSNGFAHLGALNATADIRDMIVRDVTGDGISDIVTLEERRISLWRGSSGGPLAPSYHTFEGVGTGMTVRGRTTEGLPEIAVSHALAPGSRLLLFTMSGDDRLIPVLQATLDAGAGTICSGDATGEGYDDFVLLSDRASLVLVRGRADISLEEPQTRAENLSAREETRHLCADFNGDRRVDVAVVRSDETAVEIFLATPSGGLASPVALPAAATSIAAADLDRDGDVDIIAASPAPGAYVTFLRNLGDGTFASPANFLLPATPSVMAVADVTNDGWPDVVAASEQGNVFVLQNRRR